MSSGFKYLHVLRTHLYVVPQHCDEVTTDDVLISRISTCLHDYEREGDPGRGPSVQYEIEIPRSSVCSVTELIGQAENVLLSFIKPLVKTIAKTAACKDWEAAKSLLDTLVFISEAVANGQPTLVQQGMRACPLFVRS